MKKIVVLICCCLLALPVSSRAQEVPEGWEFGGWEFFEVYHNFGDSPFFGSFYFEHDNFHYKYFECWYTRTILGTKIFVNSILNSLLESILILLRFTVKLCCRVLSHLRRINLSLASITKSLFITLSECFTLLLSRHSLTHLLEHTIESVLNILFGNQEL